MQRENTRLAIIYSVSAAFCFALLALFIKITERHLSNSMIVFFRQVFSFIVVLPILKINIGSVSNLKTKCFHLHVLRAFTSLSAMICLYYAIRYLPLTDAVLLSYTRPLFIPIVVYIWFRKKWTKNTWIGIVIGFLGVALVLKPDEKIMHIAALVGLASGMIGAIAFTSIRRLTKTEPPDRILFYYLILSIPLASFLLVNNWQMPSLGEWGLLAIIGIVGTGYQMLMNRAFKHAKAVKVGSLLYTSVIFAWMFDKILGNGTIDYISIIGIFMIIFGSYFALKEQAQP